MRCRLTLRELTSCATAVPLGAGYDEFDHVLENWKNELKHGLNFPSFSGKHRGGSDLGKACMWDRRKSAGSIGTAPT